MSSELRVTLVANAGLLIEYAGTTLLLDGIFENEVHGFSGLAPDVWQKMLSGARPFTSISSLLFTHLHPDHFSPSMTLTYLKNRKVNSVFIPEGTLKPNDLLNFLNEFQIPHVYLSEQTGKDVYQISPEIAVRPIRTLHLDKQFSHVPHFCFLITFDKKTVLFTADIDYVNETLDQLGGIHLDAVFVNPLFFKALCQKNFFGGRLKTDRICVYHIPFISDDCFGIRDQLKRDLDKLDSDLCSVITMTEPFQTILL